MGTLRYFWVHCGDFEYLEGFLGTLRYFELLLGTLMYFWVLFGTFEYFEVYIGTLRYSKVIFYILIFLGYLWDIFEISCLRDSLTEFVKDVLD